MDIEKVIHGVHERPALWDLKNKFYHNRDIVRRCWNEVAQECEVEGEQVKAKWKNLRDTFRNELKKCNKVRSGDEGGSMYQSTWPWFESMSFLKDVMTPRRMLSNLSQQDSAMGDFEQSDDSSIGSNDPGSNPSRPDVHIDDHQRGHSSSDNSVELSGSMPAPPERPLKKKRNATDSELINIEKEKLKLIERQVSAAENHDDNYHFVMSLLSMMRKLPPDAQLRTRIKMQEILLKEMNDQTTTIASFFSYFPGNVEQTSSQFSTSTGYTQL